MSTNAMWRGEPDRLKKARLEARVMRNPISRHSTMLSAYITVMSTVNKLTAFYYLQLAIWHANVLLSRREDLNHNQLDVLIQFELKLVERFPFVKWIRGTPLLQLAEREIKMAELGKKPHQLALAYMTRAEVAYGINFEKEIVEHYVRRALALEENIREEKEQPQGLRQLVRIFRKAGELYSEDRMGGHQTSQARYYLARALKLAKGGADTPDQVQKILAILQKNP